MASRPLILPLSECRDIAQAGGKAANLARLLSAGFPVPPGFAITTAAFKTARETAMKIPHELAAEIRSAYRDLGSPPVAVRSSATAEDTPDASMAGQYETFLDVRDADALLSAVQKCWQSLDSHRIKTYLTQHGIDPSSVAMAVVVQKLISADTAGVLFTANPRTGSASEMLIESAFGLGEAVVSGAVQPDTLTIDRRTGAVTEAKIAEKHFQFEPGNPERQPVPAAKRSTASLDSNAVLQLWKLGLEVARFFDAEQDLEWAIHEDRLYLLQSRPITTMKDAAARREVIQDAQDALLAAIEHDRGPWALHNLAETLPHPTPLTWSLIKPFMSGSGGFGKMYKQVGFVPSPTVETEGFLTLIAGRIYMDLSRAPEMFFDDFPYEYDLDLLATNPDAAQKPPTTPAAGFLARYRTARKLARINSNLAKKAENFDTELDRRIIPAFCDWVAEQKQIDLTKLGNLELMDLWHARAEKTLDEFAPAALLPSLMAAMALDRLTTFIQQHFWGRNPTETANLLAVTSEPDLTVASNQKLWEIANANATVEEYLTRFGHRGPEEFDLAAPRWRERLNQLQDYAGVLEGSQSPLDLHARRLQQARTVARQLREQLVPEYRGVFDEHLALLDRYLPFRENAKHYLILGYDLLRDIALEAAGRLKIAEQDLFFLTADEMQSALETGFAPLNTINRRKTAYRSERTVTLPNTITTSEISSLGEPQRAEASGASNAFPLSAGICTGPVRIVRDPAQARDLGKGYILVCPSTDPSWTPLFVNAAGLILECGGTLSHGAVVAREMAIPAVVVPNATHIYEPGRVITVNADIGRVSDADDSSPAYKPVEANEFTNVPPEMVPPIPGPREQKSAKIRNIFAAFSLAYLALAFLLPRPILYDPALKAFDLLLWPLVRTIGGPAAVILTAVALAGLTMGAQRLLTDNKRLLIAKKRANALRKQASDLPAGSPRKKTLESLASGVQTRILMAGFVPLAIILAPLVMLFIWFGQRVDPTVAAPKPGATLHVVATVEGDYLAPVRVCETQDLLRLDPATPAEQSLPPIRPTLEKLLTKYSTPSDLSDQSWELQAAAAKTRQKMKTDLANYLEHPIPPQPLSWTLHTCGHSFRAFLHLAPENAPPTRFRIVIGDRYPPAPMSYTYPADSPVRSIRIVANQPKTIESNYFWRPLAFLGARSLDVNWLLTYILAYIPAMLVFRRLLNIP